MDELNLVRLFIDWGYTRLKVWIYDSGGVLLYEQSTFTSNLAVDPSFYSSDDIARICEVIRTALRACLPATKICIYTSSQMHALAGTLFPQWDFISTWNDLPASSFMSCDVDIRGGIPVLASMPINKIKRGQDNYLLSSYNFHRIIGGIGSIASLSSPLALVLHRIFHLAIPCSQSWWQSSCLAVDHPLIDGEAGVCYVSETPINIPSAHMLEVLSIDTDVIIFPEVGDLQASTFRSTCGSDVLLNLGTGSQVIFPSLSVSKALPYFRYYTEKENSIPTISHIPCGRVLTDYVNAKAISFPTLIESINELRPSDLLRQDEGQDQTLLCFPGFSFHDYSYHQQPTTSIAELVSLSSQDLLSNWVIQYYRILCNYLVTRKRQSEDISVDIVGDLGGLADGLVSLLARMLPAEYTLHRRSSMTLPQSLLLYHEAIQRESRRR